MDSMFFPNTNKSIRLATYILTTVFDGVKLYISTEAEIQDSKYLTFFPMPHKVTTFNDLHLAVRMAEVIMEHGLVELVTIERMK